MDKAKKELKQQLVDKFNIDFTDPEYTSGDKQLFYALFVKSFDEYESSQKECASQKLTINDLRGFNDNQSNQIETLKTTHTREIKSLEEIKIGQKHTIDDLNKQLHAEKCENDSLKQGVSDYEALKRRHISKIHSLEEELVKVRSESDKVATSVRKIPLLGTDTLSYQSDFILRWQEHTKEWNDLVSDFQNKYLPTLKESIDSFVTRVKNVEI
jgi:chromosome segregation ATPase